MRVNRGFLYVGVFLVAIGAVLVAADLGGVDSGTLTDTLRLWPLAVIAIGLGLVLRRTKWSLPGGMLAAAVPGLVLGGALSIGPRVVHECGGRGEPTSMSIQGGTFDSAASVSVTGACGSIVVSTAPGNGWQLKFGNSAGRVPIVRSSPQSLSIATSAHEAWQFFNGGRDTWDLTLPTTDIDALSLAVNAGQGQIQLPGARIGRLELTSNVSDVVVDASAASVANLSGVVHVGLLAILLPANSDVTGSLRVGGGELHLCTPPGLGLHISTTGAARQVTVNGAQQAGSDWQSPDYSSASHRADLRVSVDFGAVNINPIGGCK